MPVVAPIPMPPPLDQYPQVRRHAEKLRTLEQKHARATEDHAALVAERSALLNARHRDGVAAALGDDGAVAPADQDRAARLATLDTEIDRMGHDVRVLQDALELHRGLGETIRAEATADLRQQTGKSAAAVSAAMRPLVEQLAPLNLQLIALAQAGGFSVPAAQLLLMWLDQFHAGDRG